MANPLPIVWEDKPRPVPGLTPFGFYDNDAEFQLEAPKAAKFMARRLGYPVVDVEMNDEMFYACYEEAVTEYSSQVHQFTIRENMYNIMGVQIQGAMKMNLTNMIVPPNLNHVMRIAGSYGQEAEVGGNVDWHKGWIDIKAGVQDYDLNYLWAQVSESGAVIEIKRVYHHEPIAFSYGLSSGLGYSGIPGTGGGANSSNVLSEFGWQGAVPAIASGLSYTVMPMYEDLLRMQAIEFNNQMRRSGYGFEIRNNKFRIFPIPLYDSIIYFEYIIANDRYAGTPDSGSSYHLSSSQADVVTNPANAPYDNMLYSDINAPGRRWILKYSLASAKQTLGSAVRSKYQSIPIPGSEVIMNGDALAQEGINEKEALIQQLIDMLEKTTPRYQMESQREQAENLQGTMKSVPMPIIVGILALCMIIPHSLFGVLI